MMRIKNIILSFLLGIFTVACSGAGEVADVKEVLHNPSYDVLFAEETKPGLEGFEKGQVTELGAVNEHHGRSKKRKIRIVTMR